MWDVFVEALFGRASGALDPPKLALDLILLPKHLTSTVSGSMKSRDLRARFMDSMEHNKECHTFS